jgi:hypothetical protein
MFWDSQTHGLGGPKKLAVWFFLYSGWAWLAGTGRATPETRHQVRLAQTGSWHIVVRHNSVLFWAQRPPSAWGFSRFAGGGARAVLRLAHAQTPPGISGRSQP